MRAKVEGAGDMGHSRLQHTAAVDPSRSGLKAQPGAASGWEAFLTARCCHCQQPDTPEECPLRGHWPEADEESKGPGWE